MTPPAQDRPLPDDDVPFGSLDATLFVNSTDTVDPDPGEPSNDPVAAPPFRRSNLVEVRNRLLDLGTRNPLLNLRHTAARTVRFVDTTPDAVWAALSNGDAVALTPVPEPTDAERTAAGYLEIDPETGERTVDERPKPEAWARHLGMPSEHDSSGRPDGTDETPTPRPDLQTLLFRGELDGRLRKIGNLASASIEERGASILYLVLGFLEWYESPSSKQARLAPLLVSPVTLARASRGGRGGAQDYRIEGGDEEALGNLSLEEKLRRDFGLSLPEHDGTKPETWFVAVERAVREIDPRWRVRRMVSLCLLDFTKQAMYLDLDPERWPAGKALQDHPLVSRFFTTAEGAGGDGPAGDGSPGVADAGYRAEHAIDALENAQQRYPLIAEADSSQHSAIVDAVDGVDLVIEGPPGTGKSQTITNLIAAAMAAGKRVLFVAEKMDALEVVARRLREAGLGDFLLELHSHKANRPDLLASLVDAADARAAHAEPPDLDDRIRRLEAMRAELGRTAAAMNTPWRDTGLTPHEILQRATERRERVPADAPQVQGIAPPELGRASLEDALHVAERLVSAFGELSSQAAGDDIRAHLWYGVGRAEFVGAERDALFAALEGWNAHLGEISRLLQGLAGELGPSASSRLSPADADRLADDLGRLPESVPDALFERVDELARNASGLERLREDARSLRARFDELAGALREPVLEHPEAADAFRSGLHRLEERLGVPDDRPLQAVESQPQRLATFETTCTALQREIDSLVQALPAAFRPAARPTREGWDVLAAVLESAAALPRELWNGRDARLDHPGVAALLDELDRGVADLDARREALGGAFELDRLPEPGTLHDWQRTLNAAGPFGWLRGDVRDARRSLKGLAASSRARHRALADALPALRGYREALDALDAVDRATPLLGSLYAGLDTPLVRLRALGAWYATLAGRFGRGQHDRARIGGALRELDAYEAEALLSAVDAGLPARLAEARRELEALELSYPRFFADLPEGGAIVAATDGEANESVRDGAPEAGAASPGLIAALRAELTGALGTVQPVLHDATLALGELRERGTAWRLALDDARTWRETSLVAATVPSLFDLKLAGANGRMPADVDLDTGIALGAVAASSPLLAEALRRPDPHATLARLLLAREPLRDACRAAGAARREFMSFGVVDEACWFRAGESGLESILARNAERLARRPWLDTWLAWQRVRSRGEVVRLASIVDALVRGTLATDEVGTVIEASVYRQLAEHLLAEAPEVSGIDGLHQNPLREQFARHDREVQALQRRRIAHRCTAATVVSGNGSGTVSTYTEMSLIRKERSKKTRHVAIRRLMSRASGAVGALKPCFMMSPMSVAQYLEPGRHEFDLLVMDEASQIRPEEALGAIGRAKQLVVVGDPRQLPPTSFFDKNQEEADDEEDVGLQQSESILDAVLPLFAARRLRWHYRSRHPSLIAFPNAHFYDSDLVLFPSPHGASDEFGLKFERVTDGCFESQVNLTEAGRIAAFLAEQLVNRPAESVGVVSMNVKQAEAIEVALEALAKDDPLVADAVDRAGEGREPLFVKNLERVQGDERDVIVISMTYGPVVAGGRTPQRFGPINSAVGWRRLNVLLTRSKKRMHVFSSMGAADVLADQGVPSRGKTALKDFLDYCERGHLHAPKLTGKAPDSAFEVAVMRRLAEAGYAAEPQLGVAGFFLDLAVKDPDDPGRYLLAIECDGATYHSAKSARDRDRLRQEILESLGWQVYRIWSTDWFRNPDAQMAGVLRALERARERSGG